jgi:phage shock protein A
MLIYFAKQRNKIMGQQPSIPASGEQLTSTSSSTSAVSGDAPLSAGAGADPILRLFGGTKRNKETNSPQDDHVVLLQAILRIQASEAAMCAKANEYHRLAVQAKSSRHAYDQAMYQRYAAQYVALSKQIVQVKTTLITLDQQFQTLEHQRVTIESVRALDRGNAVLARLLKDVSLKKVERTQDEMNKLVEEAQERAAASAEAQGFSVEQGDVDLDEIERVFGDAVGPGHHLDNSSASASAEEEEEEIPAPLPPPQKKVAERADGSGFEEISLF